MMGTDRMNIAVRNPLDTMLESMKEQVTTEEEIFARADLIKTFSNAVEKAVTTFLPFEIGDNYNRLVRLYGISAGGDRQSESAKKALSPQGENAFAESRLDELCARMGVSKKTAQNYGSIAKQWEEKDRKAGMTIKHYAVVSTMRRGDAIQLLERAQMGDPRGQYEDKNWRVWTVARLELERRALEHVPEAVAESAVTATVVTTKHELLEGVASALKGLPKDRATKIMRKVEKNVMQAVSEAASTMRDNMQQKIEEVTADTANARREYDKKRQHYEKLLTGVTRPVTQEEFRYLRQFCHPDRHPGNEDKARKAYEIVERLGERLQFNKKAS